MGCSDAQLFIPSEGWLQRRHSSQLVPHVQARRRHAPRIRSGLLQVVHIVAADITYWLPEPN